MVTISYDEKLGIQALATTTPDRPPVVGTHPGHLRDFFSSDFNGLYSGIVKALQAMPDDTVIDGEVVALDAEGRPSFNMFQNHGSAAAPLHFFIFDVWC